MKKIASIICVFIAFSGLFAQSANESVGALKTKITKLEAQIKDDVEIIRVLRSENRELKREIRKLKRGKIVSSKGEKGNRQVAEIERVDADSATSAHRERAKSSRESSVWDNMFPF